jgi:cation/acetate symporter
LLFIFLLYFTAPVLATLTKLQLLDPDLATSLFGKTIEEIWTSMLLDNCSMVITRMAAMMPSPKVCL